VVAEKAVDRVRALAQGIVDFMGMELVHVEVKREPGGAIVRLFIDKPGGVTLDDCSRVSRQISAQMDIDDPFEHRYTLEVSSPGLDRPLYGPRDYERFTGRSVRVTTYEPIDGQRRFAGRLVGLVEGSVHLLLPGGRELAIPLDRVAKARLEIDIAVPKASAGVRGRDA
jgi:ribosome maturation factor RimP